MGIDAIAAFSFTPGRLKGLINAPSLKSFFGLITFFLASGVQHDCHAYLASLEKYSLPVHPFFRGVVCPHYTAEVVIYLAIAVLAGPRGEVVNKTVGAGAVFVAVILGVAAGTNKEWYREKFGEEKVRGRWCILPKVY
jgi:3-oxo-5-alpha-steroid 4-dehydrogenase 3